MRGAERESPAQSASPAPLSSSVHAPYVAHQVSPSECPWTSEASSASSHTKKTTPTPILAVLALKTTPTVQDTPPTLQTTPTRHTLPVLDLISFRPISFLPTRQLSFLFSYQKNNTPKIHPNAVWAGPNLLQASKPHAQDTPSHLLQVSVVALHNSLMLLAFLPQPRLAPGEDVFESRLQQLLATHQLLPAALVHRW